MSVIYQSKNYLVYNDGRVFDINGGGFIKAIYKDGHIYEEPNTYNFKRVLIDRPNYVKLEEQGKGKALILSDAENVQLWEMSMEWKQNAKIIVYRTKDGVKSAYQVELIADETGYQVFVDCLESAKGKELE